MTTPPQVFISAASGDLRSVRQIVKEALLTINCHPIEQTNFEPDWRTVEGMLRAKIEGCQALIHIAGLRYGAEPDPATLPADATRRSYTQMEYHLGRQLQAERGDAGFRVYTFICPETFPFDAEPDVESDELRALQREHRQLLLDDPHLREKPRSRDELQARVLALQEQVFAIRRQQEEVRQEVRGARKSILGVLAVVVVLLVGVIGGVVWMKRSSDTGLNAIKADLKLDTSRIKAHLRESSERRLAEEIQAADLEAKSDARQRLKDIAQTAHQSRLSRIDELAASFALIESMSDATEEVKEMGRILQEEGVDKALAYIEGKRAALLARVAAADAARIDQRRAQLQPLLKAAALQATKGNIDRAIGGFEELLMADATWPEAISATHDLFDDLRKQGSFRGTPARDVSEASRLLEVAEKVTAAVPADHVARGLMCAALTYRARVLLTRGQLGDAEEAFVTLTKGLALAEAILGANPTSTRAGRDVTISLDNLADLLCERAQPGDKDTALRHYTRSLELREKLLVDAPSSAQALRDVSVSLGKLGDFLAQRAQPGDSEQALAHYTRSLELREKLLADNPGTAQAMRDVSLSLGKLGDFLAQHAQASNSDKALAHFTRCNELLENLLAENPGSAQAVRDVSVSLEKLGGFLARRNQPGDAKLAHSHYTRSLALGEKLLADNPGSAQAVRDVSVSLARLGDFLAQRSQLGDADSALEHYNRSLELREKLLADNPGSAQAVRDVWVSWWRIANHAETTGKGDAKAAWRKAHDLLDGMVRQGMFVSPGDLEFLETLRAKVSTK